MANWELRESGKQVLLVNISGASLFDIDVETDIARLIGAEQRIASITDGSAVAFIPVSAWGVGKGIITVTWSSRTGGDRLGPWTWPLPQRQ